MIGNWNRRQGPGPSHSHPEVSPRDSAASMSPGQNLNRRNFVELAVASAFGASLVGLAAVGPAAAAAPPQGVSSGCDGQGRGGHGETIEYANLVGIHRQMA